MPTYPATAQAIADCADKLKQGALSPCRPRRCMASPVMHQWRGYCRDLCDQSPATIQSSDLPCRRYSTARAIGRFNDTAEKLAAAFWPGPADLVVPRQADCAIHPLASAGLDTIALRVPAHETAQKLLRAVARPLVARAPIRRVA